MASGILEEMSCLEICDNVSTSFPTNASLTSDNDFFHQILVASCYAVFITLTVVGNIFVVLAYAVDKKIRKRPANLIILNLSIADFLVGASTLPLHLTRLYYGEWIFGELICKFGSAIDHLTVSISSIMIIFITIDRFIMVYKNLHYQSYQTRRRVTVMILSAWSVLIILYAILVFAWDAISGQIDGVDYTQECYINFEMSPYTSIALSIIIGYLPLTVVIILNITIVVLLKKQAKMLVKFAEERPKNVSKPNDNDKVSDAEYDNKAFKEKAKTPESTMDLSDTEEVSECPVASEAICLEDSEEAKTPARQTQRANGVQEAASGTTPNKYAKTTGVTRQQNRQETPRMKGRGSQRSRNGQENQRSQRRESASSYIMKRKKMLYKRNLRAATQLGIIVFFYALCWLPYQITVAKDASCSEPCISDIVWEITVNVQWANSGLNPLLYAVTNLRFRRRFAQFLCLGRC